MREGFANCELYRKVGRSAFSCSAELPAYGLYFRRISADGPWLKFQGATGGAAIGEHLANCFAIVCADAGAIFHRMASDPTGKCATRVRTAQGAGFHGPATLRTTSAVWLHSAKPAADGAPVRPQWVVPRRAGCARHIARARLFARRREDGFGQHHVHALVPIHQFGDVQIGSNAGEHISVVTGEMLFGDEEIDHLADGERGAGI
jgi:hypothetical protein